MDGIIVIVSCIELGLGGQSGLEALRTARLMRVLRSAKLLKQLGPLRALMHVVIQAFVDMKDFLLLLTLFLFIFSILGMGVFGGLKVPDGDELFRADFDSLLRSFYSVFEALAGESSFRNRVPDNHSYPYCASSWRASSWACHTISGVPESPACGGRVVFDVLCCSRSDQNGPGAHGEVPLI